MGIIFHPHRFSVSKREIEKKNNGWEEDAEGRIGLKWGILYKVCRSAGGEDVDFRHELGPLYLLGDGRGEKKQEAVCMREESFGGRIERMTGGHYKRFTKWGKGGMIRTSFLRGRDCDVWQSVRE